MTGYRVGHKAVNEISGGLSCTCGETFGHFSHDQDKWDAYDEHLRDVGAVTDEGSQQ